jgi:hypothetical protein
MQKHLIAGESPHQPEPAAIWGSQALHHRLEEILRKTLQRRAGIAAEAILKSSDLR